MSDATRRVLWAKLQQIHQELESLGMADRAADLYQRFLRNAGDAHYPEETLEQAVTQFQGAIDDFRWLQERSAAYRKELPLHLLPKDVAAWVRGHAATLGGQKAPGGKLYRYGATARPPGYASVPKGYVELFSHADFPFGGLAYAEPLSKADADHYSLVPIVPAQEAADTVVKSLGAYATQYLEEAEKDPRYFAQAVGQRLEAAGIHPDGATREQVAELVKQRLQGMGGGLPSDEAANQQRRKDLFAAARRVKTTGASRSPDEMRIRGDNAAQAVRQAWDNAISKHEPAPRMERDFYTSDASDLFWDYQSALQEISPATYDWLTGSDPTAENVFLWIGWLIDQAYANRFHSRVGFTNAPKAYDFNNVTDLDTFIIPHEEGGLHPGTWRKIKIFTTHSDPDALNGVVGYQHNRYLSGGYVWLQEDPRELAAAEKARHQRWVTERQEQKALEEWAKTATADEIRARRDEWRGDGYLKAVQDAAYRDEVRAKQVAATRERAIQEEALSRPYRPLYLAAEAAAKMLAGMVVDGEAPTNAIDLIEVREAPPPDYVVRMYKQGGDRRPSNSIIVRVPLLTGQDEYIQQVAFGAERLSPTDRELRQAWKEGAPWNPPPYRELESEIAARIPHDVMNALRRKAAPYYNRGGDDIVPSQVRRVEIPSGVVYGYKTRGDGDWVVIRETLAETVPKNSRAYQDFVAATDSGKAAELAAKREGKTMVDHALDTAAKLVIERGGYPTGRWFAGSIVHPYSVGETIPIRWWAPVKAGKGLVGWSALTRRLIFPIRGQPGVLKWSRWDRQAKPVEGVLWTSPPDQDTGEEAALFAALGSDRGEKAQAWLAENPNRTVEDAITRYGVDPAAFAHFIPKEPT